MTVNNTKTNPGESRGLRMKVILKPVSHPGIGDISIEDIVFPIGRREEPFLSQGGDAVSKLSRRHARVFLEDGKLYIADMGSLNGTRVNNQPVQNDATELHAGDEINLGGELIFRVEIEDEEEADETRIFYPEALPTPVLLMLMPVDTNSGIESIVVSRFPFLITRTDSVFGRYKDRYPDDLRQISRRQAVISLEGEAIYLEDLGSANGTYLSGEKLDEHVRRLSDGDTVAFGGDRFAYTVRLQQPDQEEGATGTVLAAADESRAEVNESRTTFVNSATSFLDIFCTGDDEPGQSADADPVASQGQPSAAAGSGKSAGRVHRSRALAGEFREALDNGEPVDRRKIWAGAGLLVLGLIVAIAIYILDIDRREIKELLDAGAYADSAAVGNRYLKSHADDDEAGAWALQALLKSTVPDWIESIERGNYDAAEALLVTAAQQSQSILQAQEMLDVLSLAGKVEAHIADRGGGDAPIIIFRHESRIKELVEQWNADPTRYQQLLSQIAVHVPAFEPVHARVLSDLRMLRNEHSLYGQAITRLKSDIDTSLREMDHEKISATINDFSRKYSRVGGLDALREDAERYETLAGYVAQQDLAAVSRFRRETEFQTPLFREQINAWLDGLLPPADILQHYDEAAVAWRNGEGEQAIAILEPLTAGRWGDVAARRIERYTKVNADFQALQDAGDSDDYRERLVAFRASLDASTDDYYLQAIDPEFRVFKGQSEAQLDALLNDAREQWDAYRNDGGIPGALRVEERVSERFKMQAKRLSSVYEMVSEGTQIYAAIQVTPPPAWQELHEQVGNEAKRQRRWLEDLGLVLEPALLKAKLGLLPLI